MRRDKMAAAGPRLPRSGGGGGGGAVPTGRGGGARPLSRGAAPGTRGGRPGGAVERPRPAAHARPGVTPPRLPALTQCLIAAFMTHRERGGDAALCGRESVCLPALSSVRGI